MKIHPAVHDQDTQDASLSGELTRASQRLTPNEIRIIAYGISKLDPRAAISEDHRRVRLRVEDVQGDHALFLALQDACKSLMERKLTLTGRNSRGAKTSIMARWVDEAVYREGSIELKFSERITPYLLELTHTHLSALLSDR